MVVQADVEGRLKELGESPSVDGDVRLARLEDDILRHADVEDGDAEAAAASAAASAVTVEQAAQRRGVVLCDSNEVADALLSWINRRSKSLAALNPTKLNSPSRKARTGQ